MLRSCAQGLQGLRPLRLHGLAQQLAAGQPRPASHVLKLPLRLGHTFRCSALRPLHPETCLGPTLPRNVTRALSTSAAKEEAAAEATKEAEAPADPEKHPSDVPDAPPVHPFILEVVRGLGQVVFCEHLLSGALIGAGLFIGDFTLGSLAVAGCASATATARLLKVDQGAISAGLMGYNGALVGCAFSVFLLQTPLALKAVATVLGGGATAVLASRLGKLTAPVPQWTWAFNATALATIACLRPFAGSGPPGSPLPFEALDTVDLLAGCFNGISQIFVVSSPVAGILILLGIAMHSPWAAAATLLGSVIGVVAAFLYGADATEVQDGVWGFNPALTALAVSVFLVPAGRPFQALVCGGALATVAAFVALKAAVWGAFESPCMTLPFCAVASGCFLLGGRVPGLVRARAPHSPEANLQAYHAVAGG